jgi:hypothetical protein
LEGSAGTVALPTSKPPHEIVRSVGRFFEGYESYTGLFKNKCFGESCQALLSSGLRINMIPDVTLFQ